MTTLESPRKSTYRGKFRQDHGSAALRKGREKKQPDHGYWERKYDERGVENTDKTYLKEVIRDGLDEYYSHMTPKELEQEADKILADAESQEYVEEFEGVQSHYDYEPLSYKDEMDLIDNAAIKRMTREEYADYQVRSGRSQDVVAHRRRLGRVARERQATLDADYADDDYLGDYEDGSTLR